MSVMSPPLVCILLFLLDVCMLRECWGDENAGVWEGGGGVVRMSDSSIWSPLASSTSINKLQVMQNIALRTAAGGTQDTNIQHLHDETPIPPIHQHLQLRVSQYKQKT